MLMFLVNRVFQTCGKRKDTHRQKEHAVHPERGVARVEGQPGQERAQVKQEVAPAGFDLICGFAAITWTPSRCEGCPYS